MRHLFTKHPHSVGESYLEHACKAFGFGMQMLFAGFVCIIHAIFPFLFEKTASEQLFKLVSGIIKRSPKVDKRFISLSKVINDKLVDHEKLSNDNCR